MQCSFRIKTTVPLSWASANSDEVTVLSSPCKKSLDQWSSIVMTTEMLVFETKIMLTALILSTVHLIDTVLSHCDEVFLSDVCTYLAALVYISSAMQ